MADVEDVASVTEELDQFRQDGLTRESRVRIGCYFVGERRGTRQLCRSSGNSGRGCWGKNRARKVFLDAADVSGLVGLVVGIVMIEHLHRLHNALVGELSDIARIEMFRYEMRPEIFALAGDQWFCLTIASMN